MSTEADTLEPVAHKPAPPKSEIVKKMLSRRSGATTDELVAATAWQPHSVRAFLSGLRKKGSDLTKEQRKSGEIAYRLGGKRTRAAQTDV